MKNRLKRRKFNRNYRTQFRLGKFSLGFIAVLLVALFSLLYLSQSNKMAVRGFDITELERQRAELLDERERLEVEASRRQSIQQIEEGLKNSGMVPAKKINYVTVSTAVALRE